MNRRIGILVLVLAAVTAQLLEMPTVARAALASPLILFLPGFSIVEFALKVALPPLEKAVFSVGLSLAVAVLGGVLLHLAGYLTRGGWTTILAAVTLLPLLTRVSASSATRVPASMVPPLTVRQCLMLGSGVTLALLTLVMARSGYLAHKEFSFTEFWLVAAAEAGPDAYIVGIANHEQQPSIYSAEIRLSGQLVGQWSDIPLNEGQSWTTHVNLPLRPAAKEQRAEALLFKRGAQQQVYRRVWVSVPPNAKPESSSPELKFAISAVRREPSPSTARGP